MCGHLHALVALRPGKKPRYPMGPTARSDVWETREKCTSAEDRTAIYSASSLDTISARISYISTGQPSSPSNRYVLMLH